MGSVTCKSPDLRIYISMYREQLRSSRHSMTPTPQNKALFFPWRSEIPWKFTIDFCNGFIFPQKKLGKARLIPEKSWICFVGGFSLRIGIPWDENHGSCTNIWELFPSIEHARKCRRFFGMKSSNWQYIPLIYHLYIANWVIICYHPPIKGNQETPLKKKTTTLRAQQCVKSVRVLLKVRAAGAICLSYAAMVKGLQTQGDMLFLDWFGFFWTKSDGTVLGNSYVFIYIYIYVLFYILWYIYIL